MADDNNFDEACESLIAEGLIIEGTIMSSRCVRTPEGEFVAMPHHKGPGLVVKLHRDQVAEMIAAGEGQPFAPAQKVFKEWVLVEAHDESRWQELLRQAVAFVS